MSTFLGLMLLLLAATTSPALENNFSDGTDIPQVPGSLGTRLFAHGGESGTETRFQVR